MKSSIIARLNAGMSSGYRIGQRVIVGAITPSGQCYACLEGHRSQCGADTEYGYPHALGG